MVSVHFLKILIKNLLFLLDTNLSDNTIKMKFTCSFSMTEGSAVQCSGLPVITGAIGLYDH